MPPPGGKIDPPGDGAADLTRVAAGSHLELCYHVTVGMKTEMLDVLRYAQRAIYTRGDPKP